jgi:hypothetical protein
VEVGWVMRVVSGSERERGEGEGLVYKKVRGRRGKAREGLQVEQGRSGPALGRGRGG